jgi:hypothetical protein
VQFAQGAAQWRDAPNAKWRAVRYSVAIGGKAGHVCSMRVLRVLTTAEGRASAQA